MSGAKKHAEGVRRQRDDGVIPRDTGETITYPDRATREEMGRKYRFDSPDEGEARAGLKKFQRSSDYRRFSPYRRRLF